MRLTIARFPKLTLENYNYILGSTAYNYTVSAAKQLFSMKRRFQYHVSFTNHTQYRIRGREHNNTVLHVV